MQTNHRSFPLESERAALRAKGELRLTNEASPVSGRFFYGWIIVAISMVAGFLGSGLSNITMAVMLKPISDDLGWSRGVTALMITLGSIVGGILSPFFGPVVDRYGPRLLLPLGGWQWVSWLSEWVSVVKPGSSTRPMSRLGRLRNFY